MIETEKYLQKLSANLYGMPENDKDEIVSEIRNHICEAMERQESEESVLARLGSPRKLAQSYVGLYNAENNKNILSNLAFYLSAGAGVIVVPTLILTLFTFALTAVLVLALGILSLFYDLEGVEGPIVNGVLLTGISAAILYLVIGFVLFGVAFICWFILKKYIVFVSRRYQRLRLSQRLFP